MRAHQVLLIALGCSGLIGCGGTTASEAAQDGSPPEAAGPDSGELACVGGTVQCGAACVQLSSDPANCGACGTHCGLTGACVDGNCRALAGVDAAVGSPDGEAPPDAAVRMDAGTEASTPLEAGIRRDGRRWSARRRGRHGGAGRAGVPDRPDVVPGVRGHQHLGRQLVGTATPCVPPAACAPRARAPPPRATGRCSATTSSTPGSTLQKWPGRP